MVSGVWMLHVFYWSRSMSDLWYIGVIILTQLCFKLVTVANKSQYNALLFLVVVCFGFFFFFVVLFCFVFVFCFFVCLFLFFFFFWGGGCNRYYFVFRIRSLFHIYNDLSNRSCFEALGHQLFKTLWKNEKNNTERKASILWDPRSMPMFT